MTYPPRAIPMRFDWWHKTANLALDRDDVLYRAIDVDGEREWRRLGPLPDPGLLVPRELADELAAILDARRDAFDPREEALFAYQLGLPSAESLSRR